MKAVEVTFWKGEDTEGAHKSKLHVSPDDLDIVLQAARGNHFRANYERIVECDSSDHDGVCTCFRDDE